LGKKEISESVIFGTPQSILNGINKNGKIAEIKFNIIIVDEAHTINYTNDSSCFMRILRHYKQQYPSMRLLGATGTDFRFRGCTIVGEGCLFRRRVGNITTSQLIQEKYLIEPTFNINENYIIDFSKVKVKNNGLFDHQQLTEVINNNCRLTKLICKQIIHIMESQNRFGIFIFASTTAHAREIVGYLPVSQTALILGNTPQDERSKTLDKARKGQIRYLVNIAIISVGVDIPAYDTLAYLRPTESLVLMVQTMGRVLRLSPSSGKKEALVLDFAGNIERHSDWDDPILMNALKQTIDKDKPLVIQCPQCITMNTEHARRCLGQFKEARCDYYFEFKECLNTECEAKNDIAARNCHACGKEIIDPNAKLSLLKIKSIQTELKVLRANYNITGPNRGFRLNCIYTCIDKNGSQKKVYESYSPQSNKSTNIFYGQFVRKHCKDSSKWYMHLNNRNKVELMLAEIETPSSLFIAMEGKHIKIKKKVFE
jgi:DNA repair protein RadD